MDLKELGSRIKDERERQGLTIEQVMEITKISRININAIETGNRKEFPHEVYAKGFIKNYAKALGLDAEAIGEEFSRIISPGENDDLFRAEETQHKEYTPAGNKNPYGTVLLVVVLLAIVGGLVYYLHDSSFLGGGSNDKAEIVAEQTVDKAPAVKEQDKVEPAAEVKDEKTEAVEGGEEQAEQELSPEGNAAESVAEEPVAEETPAPAPVKTVKNLVVVTAKPGEACWLEAVVDGESREYVLQEGDSLSLPYKEDLKLKLGNAGGVEVISDGKEVVFAATKGKVETFEFPQTR